MAELNSSIPILKCVAPVEFIGSLNKTKHDMNMGKGPVEKMANGWDGDMKRKMKRFGKREPECTTFLYGTGKEQTKLIES